MKNCSESTRNLEGGIRDSGTVIRFGVGRLSSHVGAS